jgi:ATP synthase F0 subunit b
LSATIIPFLLVLAEAGEKSIYTSPELWRPLNAIIFLLVLIYILRNKIGIGRIFDGRAASIKRELEQARQEKQQATDRLAEIESRLNRLDQDVAQVRDEARRESEQEAARIRETAAADAEKIAQMTRREIDGAVRTARAELRAFVAEHSVGLAESIIQREIKPEDDRRIIGEYADELREAGK